MADLTIDAAIGRGLRPAPDAPFDLGHLHEMLNLIPLGPRRARTLPQVTYPLASPSLSVAFPAPQLLRDDLLVRYFGATTLYDVSTTDFTATQRQVYHCLQNLTNRRFVDSTGWTLGSGWSVTGGSAVASSASSDLSQASGSQAVAFVSGATYLVTFTVTRSAGSVRPFIGTTGGTSRSTSGTFTEEIVASGSGVDFKLTGSSFTGSIDNISVVRKGAITSSDGWQFVAFRDRAWFACNAANFLYWLPTNPADTTGAPGVATGSGVLGVGAVGRHNGALVLGGMSGSQLSSTYAARAFAFWKSRNPQNFVTSSQESLDSSYILYGNVGGGDYNAPFYLLLALLGIPGDYEGNLFERIVKQDIKDGRMGFFRPEACGAVKNLSQLGEALICYGTNGVSRLTRGENGYTEELLLDTGVPSGNAIAGDENEHIFPSTGGAFYRLLPNGMPQLLGSSSEDMNGGGFRDLYASLTASSIVGSFDPLLRRFWFTDGTKCYCWTGYGMGESDAVQPTSLFRLANSTNLYGAAVVKSDPQVARVVTQVITNSNHTFEVSSADVVCTESTASAWKATTDKRLRQSDAFGRGTLKDVPDTGSCMVKRTGLQQRIVLQADNYKNVSLDSISATIGQGAPALSDIFDDSDTPVSETYP